MSHSELIGTISHQGGTFAISGPSISWTHVPQGLKKECQGQGPEKEGQGHRIINFRVWPCILQSKTEAQRAVSVSQVHKVTTQDPGPPSVSVNQLPKLTQGSGVTQAFDIEQFTSRDSWRELIALGKGPSLPLY